MIPSNVQQGVAEEVNSRLEKATHELQAKYARGEGGQDSSVDGPTGQAYLEKAAAEAKDKKDKRRQAAQENTPANTNQKENNNNGDEGEDDEDDYDLRELRAARLKQLKASTQQRLDNVRKGHGQNREVLQDEFLSEVTSSERVICHFYHDDFQRCEIMNHHLSILAQKHIEAKFIKINAEKAPFFVEKLKIRTIPTLVIFRDGVGVEKVLGFEGLADGQPVGKEDEWPTITLARLLASKGGIDMSHIIDEEDREKEAKNTMESMRQAMLMAALDENDDDLDLNDD